MCLFSPFSVQIPTVRRVNICVKLIGATEEKSRSSTRSILSVKVIQNKFLSHDFLCHDISGHCMSRRYEDVGGKTRSNTKQHEQTLTTRAIMIQHEQTRTNIDQHKQALIYTRTNTNPEGFVRTNTNQYEQTLICIKNIM